MWNAQGDLEYRPARVSGTEALLRLPIRDAIIDRYKKGAIESGQVEGPVAEVI